MTGAIVGCGRIAHEHVEGLIDAGIQIIGLVNRTSQRAESLRDRYGLDANVFQTVSDMLAVLTPEIVSVAVADAFHESVVRKIIAHGIPTICEKPLAPTANVARSLWQLAHDAGVPAAVRMPLRAYPVYRAARALIRSGEIGRPFAVHGRLSLPRLSDPTAPIEWRMLQQEAPLGVLGDLGSHFFDLTRYLLDSDEESLLSGTGAGAIVIRNRPADAAGRTIVETPDVVNVTCSWSAPSDTVVGPDRTPLQGVFSFSRVSPGEHCFQIDGTDGSLRVSQAVLTRYLRVISNHQTPASQWEPVDVAEMIQQSQPDHASSQLNVRHREFTASARMVQSGAPATPSLWDGYIVSRDLEMIRMTTVGNGNAP